MKKTLLTLTLFISCGSGFSASAECPFDYCTTCTCEYVPGIGKTLSGAPYPVLELSNSNDAPIMLNWCAGGIECAEWCKKQPAPPGKVSIKGKMKPYPKANWGLCS